MSIPPIGGGGKGSSDTGTVSQNNVRRDGSKSWAAVLGTGIPTTLNKNILEIVLEKDDRGPFNVSEEDCASVMRKLGLDQRVGFNVEGVQICPNGRGVILITLKDNVPVENFCRFDVFEMTTFILFS